jgi:hypothetical protein
MTDLFAYAAETAKLAGMAQVEANASPPWSDRMYECVGDIAGRLKRFTSDDVIELAEERGWALGTHDLRAFGPVMMRAARAGICRKADCAPINSRRASLHASPRAVWESLLI